ncbi:PH domain-containing protein [Candidatus Parcubacteria bacterium]|nr:PH domain-containing protein [Candidatus Parcubacteria bacterium]
MKAQAKKRAAGTFAGQHEGESVRLVFHQHPLVMRKALIFGLLAILIAVLPLLVWPLSDVATKIALYTPLAVLAYWFYHWISWYYSVYVVTNERIVEIKQRGFFNRRVIEFGLDKVQNVNYHVKGFQAVLFQFGDITVQTYVGDLVMSTVYKPVQVHQQIVEVVRRYSSSSTPLGD